MRLAIISDIHANLQALEAVLADVYANECDEVHVLGDIVGYNANPSECLELVRRLPGVCVLGNHDEGLFREDLLENLSKTASTVLEWTRTVLTAEQKIWLAALRPVRQIRRTTLVHATLDSPTSWGYIRVPSAAELSFICQRTQLCFFGHTHIPMVFIHGVGKMAFQETMHLRLDHKLLINAGSVGQPRDGDWRACYLIYDEESQTLYKRRVEYDVHAARQAVLDAGLPRSLGDRLLTGN